MSDYTNGGYALPAPTPAEIEHQKLEQLAADVSARLANLDRLTEQLDAYAQKLSAQERDLAQREEDLLAAGREMAQWRRERANILQNERRQHGRRRRTEPAAGAA